MVEADVELQSTSAESVQFFAKNVELLSEAGDEGLEGVVFQVNSTGQFVLMVSDEHNLSSLSSGDFVTVNADPAEAVFGIESTDLAVSSSAFASGADLLAGQTLDVTITPGSLVMADAGCATLADACSASATALRLKKSVLTAQVSGTSVPNFTLTSLPSLFGSFTFFRPLSAGCQSCAVGSMTVVTSDQTQFEDGLAGLSSLQVGDTVTMRGILIKDGLLGPGPIPAGSPQLIAAKVRRLTP